MVEANLPGYYIANDPDVPKLGANFEDYLHTNLYFIFLPCCMPIMSCLFSEKAQSAKRTAQIQAKSMREVTRMVHDARKMEEEQCLASKRTCLDRYGFTLLPHKTSMKDDDFTANPMAPQYLRTYSPEMMKLVQELYPEAKAVEYFGAVIHGEGWLPQAHGIHQDFPISAMDMGWGHPAVKQGFDQADCKGAMIINFWRPIRTSDPIQDAPLAVLDPKTVEAEDMIPAVLYMPGGSTKQMRLRDNPEHMWYYYPDMTTDEVLVFKTFEYFKGQHEHDLRTCFHTAFKDPSAPTGAKKRVASVLRFKVFF
eukprot:TRINITY_DN11124_c0_g1_i1.p1 TRINITY_DN11124_c0_g1~~TRINITY_DN11124_c0_g1_i1.p1  ORF type:complete len:309 (+),score=54.73 TRINITY_DN11124_c0_g1_i1:87-1013(+)